MVLELNEHHIVSMFVNALLVDNNLSSNPRVLLVAVVEGLD